MTSLFNANDTQQILSRIQNLRPDTKPGWGKMNVAQMLAHCTAPFEVYFGKLKLKQGLIGFLFGRMTLKKMLSDRPWPRNLPTAKEFVMADEKTFETERDRLVSQVKHFQTEGKLKAPTIHPFFGKMSTEEWDLLAYKHLDHHLQQFGV